MPGNSALFPYPEPFLTYSTANTNANKLDKPGRGPGSVPMMGTSVAALTRPSIPTSRTHKVCSHQQVFPLISRGNGAASLCCADRIPEP